MRSNEIGQLAAALASAQGEMAGAKKDSTNPHFKSKYADLASVWEAARGPLAKNGLSVTQTIEADRLVTTLMHKSGEFIDSSAPIVQDRPGIQAYGAALSYMRRYSLAAILGIYQEDDDAQSATVAKPVNRIVADAPPKELIQPDVIPWGELKGKRLSEVPVAELEATLRKAEAAAAKKGGDVSILGDKAIEVYTLIEAYLEMKDEAQNEFK